MNEYWKFDQVLKDSKFFEYFPINSISSKNELQNSNIIRQIFGCRKIIFKWVKLLFANRQWKKIVSLIVLKNYFTLILLITFKKKILLEFIN